MKARLFFLLLGVFVPFVVVAAPAEIINIHVQQKREITQVIIALNRPVKPRVFSLTHPNRIILDFENTRSSVKLKKLRFSRKHLIAMRDGYPKPGILRMVLDVNEDVHYKSVSKDYTKQITLDLISKKNSVSSSPKNIKQVLSAKPIIVVIDPGHGGKDPGAIGDKGTQEKDVVLSIAKMLANLINKQPNMRAVLTRDGDYFVSLRKRLLMARESKADLFIAVHADSYFNNRAMGASVYTLSRHGASSVAARWLAQRENHSELDGVNLDGLEDQSVILRSVLLDLAQTATNRASLRWGGSLLDSLNDVTKLHYSRVERAPFMVLKSPDIPSILVETGFISNKKEEARLRDKNHQHKLALALFAGITSYQKKYVTREV